MSDRYALYALPRPGSPLWQWGSAILGYDAATGERLPHPAPFAGIPDWEELTAEPRTYGFHATLKPPFRLGAGQDEAALQAAAVAFAAARAPFEAGPLAVTALGSFVALTPAADPGPLDRLAAACVEVFEPFRAPLNESEMAKRLRSPLTPRQHDYLTRWGYPYVFDEFRFHMTLTGRLPAERRDAIRTALAQAHAPVAAPLLVEGIGLFRQPGGAGRFVLAAFLPFTGDQAP